MQLVEATEILAISGCLGGQPARDTMLAYTYTNLVCLKLHLTELLLTLRFLSGVSCRPIRNSFEALYDICRRRRRESLELGSPSAWHTEHLCALR